MCKRGDNSRGGDDDSIFRRICISRTAEYKDNHLRGTNEEVDEKEKDKLNG